ncbi:BMC domain-containing protein [Hafnia alvei]|uniref:BMC domain-containing protein n=1 Tax=Hafnia alvei TaxID=569 RepID=UPI0010352AC8|nr:BMC domain-containing protein [Hafnia alvei]TBL90220.1 BMC domain-containing protein [Hafnia alvei]
MINALGLLEVSGLVAGIDAADAMLKAAQVRVLNHEVVDPGLVTLVIEGDLAACRAALDAGAAAASRTGTVISRKEIGRPDPDTEWLILGLRGLAPTSSPAPAAEIVQPALAETEISGDEMAVSQAWLAEIASHAQGMTAGEMAARFQLSLKQTRHTLEALLREGKLRKRGSRYRIKVAKEEGHE